jgi:hypothetical protein
LLHHPENPELNAGTRLRDIAFVILGVLGLLFKRHYSGLAEELVESYGGNLAISFAVYFLAKHLPYRGRHRRLLATCSALGAVELFEALNGFGIMTNVYDPFDFLANAVGTSLALLVDTMLDARHTPSKNTHELRS